jgi:leader peptidase (prepilin peptidase)/N-methyltransferase
MGIILGALFFGLAGYVGILLAGTIRIDEPLDGAPISAEPPIPWIVAGSAVIGAFVASYSGNASQTLLYAIVVCALAAIWCTDVRYGIVPDAFTLGPLALFFLIAVIQQNPVLFASAAVLFVPFALTALLSKGRGMGWGDVKLAALGGAVLGAPLALIAFSASCLIAVIYAYARGRHGQVIAFAPYLAGGIAIAMPLGALR